MYSKKYFFFKSSFNDFWLFCWNNVIAWCKWLCVLSLQKYIRRSNEGDGGQSFISNICCCRNGILFKDESLYVIRMNQLGIPNTLTLDISCLVFLNLSHCPPAVFSEMLYIVEHLSMMVNNVLGIFCCML